MKPHKLRRPRESLLLLHVRERSGDLPASRNSAAAISVERIGEGRGSWRSLRGMAVATRNVRDFGHMGVDVIDDPWAGA